MAGFSEHPVVIAGESHTGSIVGWQTLVPPQLVPCKDIDGLFTVRDSWPRSPDYYKTVIDFVLSNDNLIPTFFIRGNDHLGSFLLEPEEPIDFLSSRFPALSVNPSARIVAEEMVDEYFYKFYRPFREIFSELTRSGRKFISMATPPPKGNDAFLRNSLANEAHFVNVLQHRGQTIESVRLTIPQTRLKLWGAICKANERVTREAGGEFLEVPPSGQDESGFLRETYYGTDCTHADFHYGDLVIRHIFDYLQARES